MPRVYIWGPIRNMPDGSRAAFAEAAEAWRKCGWEVITPWELEFQHGWSSGVDNTAHRMHCLRDIAALSLCAALALLPGSNKSPGAQADMACAYWIQLPRHDANFPLTWESVEAELKK